MTQHEKNQVTVKKEKNAKGRPGLRIWPLVIAIALIAVLMFEVIIQLRHSEQAKQIWQENQVQHNQILQAQQDRLEQVEQEMSKLKANLQQQQTIAEATQKTAKRVLKLDKQHDADWLLDEVAHLLRLAEINLQVYHQAPAALPLLQAADHRLATIPQASVTALRRLINADMTQLRAVLPIDMNGILLRLHHVEQQLKVLSVIKPVLLDEKQKVLPVKKKTETSLWSQALQQLWHGLEEVVVIRKQAPGLTAPLTPEQQFFAEKEIQLSLLQAKWALLNRQKTIYQQSLQQAKSQLSQYFDIHAPATQAMLTELNALQNQIMIVPLPDLQATLLEVNRLQQQD